MLRWRLEISWYMKQNVSDGRCSDGDGGVGRGRGMKGATWPKLPLHGVWCCPTLPGLATSTGVPVCNLSIIVASLIYCHCFST